MRRKSCSGRSPRSPSAGRARRGRRYFPSDRRHRAAAGRDGRTFLRDDRRHYLAGDDGQGQRKDGPVALRGTQADVGSEQSGDAMGNGEAEAETGIRIARTVFDLEELVEYFRLVLRRDAGAVVAHLDPYGIPPPACADQHRAFRENLIALSIRFPSSRVSSAGSVSEVLSVAETADGPRGLPPARYRCRRAAKSVCRATCLRSGVIFAMSSREMSSRLRSCPAIERLADSMRSTRTFCSGSLVTRVRSARNSCSACRGWRRSWLAAAEACLGVSQAQGLVATCLQFTRGVLDTEFERFVAAPEFVRDDGQLLQLAPDQHAGNQQREQCESRKQCSAPGLLPPLLGQQRAGVILMTRRLLCPGTGSVVATKEPLSWVLRFMFRAGSQMHRQPGLVGNRHLHGRAAERRPHSANGRGSRSCPRH